MLVLVEKKIGGVGHRPLISLWIAIYTLKDPIRYARGDYHESFIYSPLFTRRHTQEQSQPDLPNFLPGNVRNARAPRDDVGESNRSGTSLTANVVSASQVNLAWKSVAGATSYLVDEWVNGAWKQIGNFASNTIGCSIPGLTAGATYYFDVAAHNSSSTTWANFVTTVTIDRPMRRVPTRT